MALAAALTLITTNPRPPIILTNHNHNRHPTVHNRHLPLPLPLPLSALPPPATTTMIPSNKPATPWTKPNNGLKSCAAHDVRSAWRRSPVPEPRMGISEDLARMMRVPPA